MLSLSGSTVRASAANRVRCAAGLLLLLAALLAPSARAAEAPSHAFLFALKGFTKEPGHILVPPPEGEFEDACGVAVDSAGDIYVADYYHRTIDVYNSSREYLTQILDPDPDGPCNLAVDSAGRLYVNHWRRDVVRFTPSEFPPSESTTYGPGTVIDSARSTGVTVDPASGNIYIDDRTYVAVYEPSGAPVLFEGAPLQIGLGSLGSGYGVAVSNFAATEGYVYVADAFDHTVKVYDPAMDLINPVQIIDGAGTPQRGFVSLADSNVAIDQADGHIFVADNTEPGFEHPAAVVDEFNSSGDYRGQLPRAIVDAEPSALAVDNSGVPDSQGDVYVTSGNSEGASVYGFGPTESAHSLKVTKTGSGAGTVTSEPAGINCGSACAAEFNAGSEVTLTAVPDPGSAFTGWSGGCTGVGACHLSGAVTEIGAEFEALPPQPLLPAEPAGAAKGAAAISAAAFTTTASSPGPLQLHTGQRRHHRRHRHKGRDLQAKGGRP